MAALIADVCLGAVAMGARMRHGSASQLTSHMRSGSFKRNSGGPKPDDFE